MGWAFGSMDYGEDWRACRKMTHHVFHGTSFEKYRPVLTRRAHEFIGRIVKEGGARIPVHLKQ